MLKVTLECLITGYSWNVRQFSNKDYAATNIEVSADICIGVSCCMCCPLYIDMCLYIIDVSIGIVDIRVGAVDRCICVVL